MTKNVQNCMEEAVKSYIRLVLSHACIWTEMDEATEPTTFHLKPYAPMYANTS